MMNPKASPQIEAASVVPGLDRPLRVGYILKMFPRLSETFILNELLELERQGVELSVFSLMHPDDGRFHGRLAELKVKADYIPSDRPENHWNALRALPDSESIPIHRWNEAADFLRRHAIPRDLELLLRAVLIAARVRRDGIEHLHAHFATVATRVAALVHMLTGVPFSFTAHAKDIFRETVNRDLLSELIDRAAFAVTVSDFNREYIRSKAPRPEAGNLYRLYNGIDLGFFHPVPVPDPARTPRIVSIGRLVPKKGFDHLLYALCLCKQRGIRFRATIVGDGDQYENLLRLRGELGLTDEVEFAGALPQEQVRLLLGQATIMALACVPDMDGNMDALPTVLLEALALDVPIASTRLTGIPEIVGEEAGLLVEPGDDAALAEAIEALCERCRSGEQIAGACRSRAEELFDLRKNVAELRGLFVDSSAEPGR